MSLNCLACHQVLQRTDSNNDLRNYDNNNNEKDIKRFWGIKVDRSWSGNLSPVAFEHVRNNTDPSTPPAKKMLKKGHRRLNTIDTTFRMVSFEADGEPKLVRSSGMRRDWSFEDLGGTNRGENMRNEIGVR
ncbi:hypothetical protein CCACVL1_15108 [Corchorus capsularis]|uniref:Uncharacterized protein n=1 Tax=Corchorus capsularis TaxID=210143 RepID=A0A1R3I3Z3_COCAP|nr:hypothetical protein CCACVL1_15108 [Corchorus capsularis]